MDNVKGNSDSSSHFNCLLSPGKQKEKEKEKFIPVTVRNKLIAEN